MFEHGNRRKAPWKDYRGVDIFEGDTIAHPSGECGIVVFLPKEKEPGDQWRVSYVGSNDLSRLGLQIGNKGQAFVIATKEEAKPGIPGMAKSIGAWLWDVVIPRFLTEEVAIMFVGDPIGANNGWGDYEIVCSLSDAQPGESFDGIATVDAFQAFGFGFAYRIGNFRAWPDAPTSMVEANG